MWVARTGPYLLSAAHGTHLDGEGRRGGDRLEAGGRGAGQTGVGKL